MPRGPEPAKIAIVTLPTNSEPRAPLDVFFHPRNVAVIGATEELSSVGHSVVANLKQSSFGGQVFPVNPKRSAVLDLPCFPNVASVPAKVDLAVIVTPARTVPGLIAECSAAGVAGAIIISAGFKEVGPLRRRAGAGDPARGPQEPHARRRAELLGHHVPAIRLECHLRQLHGAARPSWIHQSEWRAVHRHPGLEPSRDGRLQRLRLRGFHAGCRLGRFDPVSGGRSAHPQHRDLYGIGG